MTIGERIKEVRTRLNMNQVSFADRIDVSKQTLYKYENDIITNIPSDKIEAIAKIGNVSPAYLMGWEKADDEIADAFQQDMEQEIIQKMNSVFSKEKVTHFEKYNQLNKHNMNLVDSYTEKLLSIQEMEEELYVNAASQRTDIEAPEETDTSDNDIMDDENF